MSVFLNELGESREEIPEEALDKDTHNRVKRVTYGLNETLHHLANEPSLGIYRIQEHVSRSVPSLVDSKRELQSMNQRLEGAIHDTEYALEYVLYAVGKATAALDGFAQLTIMMFFFGGVFILVSPPPWTLAPQLCLLPPLQRRTVQGMRGIRQIGNIQSCLVAAIAAQQAINKLPPSGQQLGSESPASARRTPAATPPATPAKTPAKTPEPATPASADIAPTAGSSVQSSPAAYDPFSVLPPSGQQATTKTIPVGQLSPSGTAAPSAAESGTRTSATGKPKRSRKKGAATLVPKTF
eukprot:m.52512 g.52512  ORF g.52512 m.52512 type:complete len:297 (+) comp6699_c0_seq1:199-1089(+)